MPSNIVSVSYTHLITLVEDIIRLSKLDEESVELEKEDVDLYALCREIVSRLSPQANAKKVHIVVAVSYTHLDVYKRQAIRSHCTAASYFLRINILSWVRPVEKIQIRYLLRSFKAAVGRQGPVVRIYVRAISVPVESGCYAGSVT